MPVVLRLLLISFSWIVIEIGSGYLAHRLPRRLYQTERYLFRSRAWERSGAVYQRILRIKRWKDRLPEAGAFFAGGVSKRQLGSLSREEVSMRIAETRRAELTHWLAALLSVTFFAWNPVSVAIWMPPIGLLANAPFIAVQRHLRPRLVRLLARYD